MEMAASCAPRDVVALVATHLPTPVTLDGFEESRILRVPPSSDWRVRRDFEGGEQDSLDALLHSARVNVVKPDIVHVSHIFEGYGDPAALPSAAGRPIGQVLSTTLYDLIPLRFRDHYLKDERWRRWYLHRLKWLQQADLLLSISEASRQGAIELLGIDPSKIVTIHGGVPAHFKPVSDKPAALERLREKYGICRKGFVLYTGGDDHRKNLRGAIIAFAQLPAHLRRELQLVIVCAIQDHRKQEYNRLARKVGLSGRDILLLGFVPDEDLVALYSTCGLFFFPSLYEGLGLPVLEAMACAAPVIGGDNSSIRELIDRNDALFNSADPSSIARVMQGVLSDEGLADELRRHGAEQSKKFTWKNAARLALEAFDEALQRNRETGVRCALGGWLPRKRLAMFTPLPPCRSGIADYNAQFLPYLARYFEIDLYVDGYKVSDEKLSSMFRIFDARDFRASAHAYDAILYEFGNSEFHAHMLPLLADFPGIVGLHDAFLSGLMGYLQFNLKEKDRYVREMLDAHAGLARRLMAPARKHPDSIGTAMIELPCTKRVLDQAIGLISHSPFNLQVARRMHPEGWLAPYRIIPQMVAMPEERSPNEVHEARASLGYAASDVIIATFGHVAWTKCGDRLLEAFLHSPLVEDARCQLVFAGELAKDDFGRALSDRIRKSGLENRIRITGFLSTEDYQRYLRVADVAVQLRTKSRGGTPRGVLDCLAHGVPVVVNDAASYRDYPDHAVIKLSLDPTAGEIGECLLSLRQDEDKRMRYAANGRRYVREQHDPEHCAAQYAATMHDFISREGALRSESYAKPLAAHLAGCPDPMLAAGKAAEFLDARPTLSFARPRLFIDVSHIARNDHGTGIPRVIKETVRAAYCSTRTGFEAVAVELAGDRFRRADRWLDDLGLLLPHELALEGGREMTFRPGDHLLMLDSSWARYAEFGPVFEQARKMRVPITTAVYDLLPLTLPPGNIVEGGKEWFENWLRNAIAASDGLVCISKAVADEVVAYVMRHGLAREGLKVGYWHLGSTFSADAAACPPDSPVRNRQLAPYCLMVGTIEPRKSHALVLDAFEQLWEQGVELSLVIAGKPGWMVDALLERIRAHELLNEKLYLFERTSDAEIGYLYQNAAALLFLSKGEGFGLPLVEAAHYGTPIICSDLPVFHEIAGDHATYVKIEDAAFLARDIGGWWDRFKAGAKLSSADMPRLSWEQSAEALIDVVIGQNWYWVK